MEEKETEEIEVDVSPEYFQDISRCLEDKDTKIVLDSVTDLRKMLQLGTGYKFC